LYTIFKANKFGAVAASFFGENLFLNRKKTEKKQILFSGQGRASIAIDMKYKKKKLQQNKLQL
jgi:hypothetical protein